MITEEMINYDVLDSLNTINSITQEYEIKVACSLLDSYIKAYALMDNGSYNNHRFFNEQFDIIQEASGDSEQSKEGAGSKILNLIASIINAIINSIKKLFSDPDIDSENMKKEAELAAKRRKARPPVLNKIEDAINKANEESDELEEDDKLRKLRIAKSLASLGLGTATTVATWAMMVRKNEMGFVAMDKGQVCFLFNKDKVIKYYKERLDALKSYTKDLEDFFKDYDEDDHDISSAIQIEFDEDDPTYYPFDIYDDDKKMQSQNTINKFITDMDKIVKEIETELKKALDIVKKFKNEHKKLKIQKFHKTETYLKYNELIKDYATFKTGLHNLNSANGKNMDGFFRNLIEKGLLAAGSAAAIGGATGIVREFTDEDLQMWVKTFFGKNK